MATANDKIVVSTEQEEGLAEDEYAVWSPYDAHKATVTLMQLSEQAKVGATQTQTTHVKYMELKIV